MLTTYHRKASSRVEIDATRHHGYSLFASIDNVCIFFAFKWKWTHA